MIKGKRILVTGGAGFIGSHLVDSLVNHNTVTVLDNLSSSDTRYLEAYIKEGKIRFIKGDIRKFDIVNEACKNNEVIFHYAADPNVKNSAQHPIQNFETNVIGTLNLLEASRKNDVELFVFASSGGTVYGESEKPLKESSPLNPLSCYGASKVCGEAYITAYSNTYGFRSIRLRYGNIYGPRSTHGVIYDFFMKLKKDPSKLLILGDGNQRKSYLYISDCISASLLASEKTTKLTDVYNIASDDWITVKEIAKIVTEAVGLENVKFEYTGGERGWVGDVAKIHLDVSKIKEMGWKQTVSIEDGIKRYIGWLKKYIR
ncbi:MAG: NAD-dependent epimerase/dehydratase family protein [Candidatus Odinarchaeia archaeon]